MVKMSFTLRIRAAKDTPPQGTDCTPKQELNPNLKGRWAPLRSLHGCNELVDFVLFRHDGTSPSHLDQVAGTERGRPLDICTSCIGGQSFSFFPGNQP